MSGLVAVRPVCLITGATGAIGPSVVAAMHRTHEVRTLSRSLPADGTFRQAVTAYTGDVTDDKILRGAANGVDVIVHLAALLHVVNPEPGMRAEYERVNVGGTAAVIRAALSEGVRRVVLLSTIAVYGRAGEVLNEESTPSPETFYGQTKLAAEQIVLHAQRADGAPLSVVLRSAAVYGPRVKGNYRALVEAIRRRRFLRIGPGDNRRTLVFEADLTTAIALAATHPAAAGRIYNVTDGHFHPMRDILNAIASAMGRRPPAWHAPIVPVVMMAKLAGVVAPAIPKAVEKYLEEVCVEGRRMQEELGFSPQFDLDRGWAATIEQMRSV
ncbi:SDR family oxidoreductase [soil metagenome]